MAPLGAGIDRKTVGRDQVQDGRDPVDSRLQVHVVAVEASGQALAPSAVCSEVSL